MAKTATRKQRASAHRQFISELMGDYGCSERELRDRLKEARIWAHSHGVGFMGPASDESAEGYSVDVGPVICTGPYDPVRRLYISCSTDGTSYRGAAHHRKLLYAALALFLYSHPVTRKKIEAGGQHTTS